MELQELLKYNILYYNNNNFLINYAYPQKIVDEGSILRIHEINIIDKSDISNIYVKDGWVVIKYENGNKIMLEIEV